jgi:hypothetical protein
MSLTDCSPSYAPEIVQQYHTSIGGPAENALEKTKSKQSRHFRSEAKEPPAPAAKRQKRNILDPALSITQEESAWVPTKEDWEPQVVKVEAVERDEAGKLLAYILFKNGKQTQRRLHTVSCLPALFILRVIVAKILTLQSRLRASKATN